jgi:hypothetical protein
VGIGHINGFERDSSPINLIFNCRSCNTQLGIVFKKLGLGRRTRQFNPEAKGAENLSEWLTAVFSMKGQSKEMSVPAAVEMIRATSPEKRSEFANEIWNRRRQHGTARKEEVPF